MVNVNESPGLTPEPPVRAVAESTVTNASGAVVVVDAVTRADDALSGLLIAATTAVDVEITLAEASVLRLTYISLPVTPTPSVEFGPVFLNSIVILLPPAP